MNVVKLLHKFQSTANENDLSQAIKKTAKVFPSPRVEAFEGGERVGRLKASRISDPLTTEDHPGEIRRKRTYSTQYAFYPMMHDKR